MRISGQRARVSCCILMFKDFGNDGSAVVKGEIMSDFRVLDLQTELKFHYQLFSLRHILSLLSCLLYLLQYVLLFLIFLISILIIIFIILILYTY